MPNAENDGYTVLDEVFEGIDDPRAKFQNNYVDAFDELIWRAFRILFRPGRIEHATTRELIALLGSSVDRMDRIRELTALMALSGDGAKAERQKHLWAQGKVQELMKEFGLSREEALEMIKQDAPTVHELAVAGQHSKQNNASQSDGYLYNGETKVN